MAKPAMRVPATEPAPEAERPSHLRLVEPGEAAAPEQPAGTRLAIGNEETCRELSCESLATTGGYCRLHYIKNWQLIKRKERILSEGRLQRYIEDLAARQPDSVLRAIRDDLATDDHLAEVIRMYELRAAEEEDEGEEENPIVEESGPISIDGYGIHERSGPDGRDGEDTGTGGF